MRMTLKEAQAIVELYKVYQLQSGLDIGPYYYDICVLVAEAKDVVDAAARVVFTVGIIEGVDEWFGISVVHGSRFDARVFGDTKDEVAHRAELIRKALQDDADSD